MLSAAIFVIFPFCMVYAAVSDMLTMTIANRVSILLVAAFAVLAPLSGMDWQTYGLHFAAGGVALVITFGLFAIGAMGGGDAKLIAATAVWMGLGIPLAQYAVWSGVIGGLLTLAILAFRNSPLSVYAGNNLFMRHLADAKAGIPYGIALGIAGLLAFPNSPLVLLALSAR